MTVSFAQLATLACPACSASFDADIWLIVAANERPDLIERIRAGALHTVTCPRCGHAGNLDAPLLLFRPDADPPILFSPAQGTTSEQDQQQAAALVGLLRERLGSAWREAWLAQGLRGVQREMLPIVLADDPEAALRDMQVQMQRAINELRERDPETFARLEAEMWQAIKASGGGGSGPPVPAIFTSWLATALQAEQQFLQTNDLTALTMAVETWNQILDHPGFRTAPPNFRLAVLNNAGVVFLRRYWGRGHIEDLNRALDLWSEAVAATPPDSPDRPMYLTNLGNGLRARYARTGRLDDLEQAQVHYATACERGQLLAPEVALAAAQAWGRWASERAAWEEAVRAFEFGLATVEQLHQTQLRRSDQEAWLSSARGLHTRAAYALVRMAESALFRRAVEVAEIGRARGLGETLARDRGDLALIERDHPAIYERYRAAAETVRSLERADRAAEQQAQPEAAHLTELAARIRAARAALDAAIEAIRALPGYEGFLRPLLYTEITAAARPGAPLVYLITTPQGSLALIVPHAAAEPEALLLDGFTAADLDTLLIERTNDEVVGGYLPGQFLGGAALTAALERGLPRLGAALIAPLAARLRDLAATGVTLIPTGLLSLRPLHAATYAVDGQPRCLLDEFDVAYAPSARALATAQHELKRRAAGPLRLAGVGNPLPAIETGAWAQRELAQALPAIKQQAARLLPAIETAARSAPPEVRKRFEQVASRWRASLKRLEELIDQTPDQVVKAGHDLALAAALFADLPDGAGQPLAAIARRLPPSLTYARSELASVLDLLPPGAGAPLYEHAATRDALWANLPGAAIAHFACHGQFDADDTLESALLLAGDSRLTLRELVAGDTAALASVRLAVLSACQTAITDFQRLPDESIGLPGGFLQAGVPAVVGSLWSVNDLSTALLMHRFYELHLKGDSEAGLKPQPPARALRLAQVWLRDLTYKAMFAYFERHRRLKAARRLQTESAATATTRMPLDLVAAGRAKAEDGMLDDPSRRPYVDPVYWAAFTFNGALEGA